MIPSTLLAALSLARKFVIRHPCGAPYITRHVLWGISSLSEHDPECVSSAYVHALHTPDGDRHMHDHPWNWSCGLILSGGYTERRSVFGAAVENTYRPGDLNVLRHGDYHSILRVLPDTQTLFLTGREISDWGFLVDGEHVPHREYLARSDSQKMTHTEG